MYGREKCDKIKLKMKKFLRLAKYLLLSIVFVVFAFLRWVTGGHSNELDNKRLSKDDLNKSLSHFPEANADVTGGGGGDDGGGDGDDDGGGGGGC